MSDLAVGPGGLLRRDPPWYAAFYRGGVLPVFVIAMLYGLLVGGNVYWIYVGTEVGIYLLVSLGTNFLFGYAGQAFLGQAALVAVGAYTTGLLTVNHHWPFWPAAVVSIVVAVVAGLLVALPSLRLSAWYFALITLGLDQLVHDLLQQFKFTGGANGILGVPLPSVAGQMLSARDMYWLVAVLDLLTALLVFTLVRSRFGRGMVGLRDARAAVPASGASPLILKMIAFSVAAATCGLAGSILASINTVIVPDDFGTTFAVFFIVAVVVGGSGRLWGPLVGCLAFFAVPDLLHFLASYQLLVYGLALLVLMRFAPDGLLGLASLVWHRLLRPRFVALRGVRAAPPTTEGVSSAPAVPPVEPPALFPAASDTRANGDAAGGSLVFEDVTLSFGGVRALDGLSFVIPAGGLHAIVGPNGSGKTTALNAASGYYRPESGIIRFDGHSLIGMPTYKVARLGIGRTFQTPRILGSLDVRDNILLGAFAQEEATLAEVALRLGRARRESRALQSRAEEVARLLGVADLLDQRGDSIAHGPRRLVEVARTLMGDPRLLLLDEPAGGLDDRDIEQLSATLARVAREGTTVVLIEHHIDLVTALAEQVIVIDRGETIAEGRPADVFALKHVAAAYMGSAVSNAIPS